MKTRLLIGSAIAATMAVAGVAQADSFTQSATSRPLFGIFGGPTVNLAANNGGPAALGALDNTVSIFLGGEEISSWILIDGESADNIGNLTDEAGATFTLQGEVDQFCMFYTGNVNTTLDFGTLGVIALDNGGVDQAFDMVDDAEATIETNVAGCNTANTVVLTSTDMVNASAASQGYDEDQFTAALPFSVEAEWTGVLQGEVDSGYAQTLTLAAGDNHEQKAQGAWKSHFVMELEVEAPTKSLVAGEYEGDLTVTISAI